MDLLMRRQSENKTFREFAANGNVKEMEELYNRGNIDINGISPSTGRSALHWAAMYGHEDAVRFLLAKGAILDLKDNTQHTPFDLACENNHFVVARLIKVDSDANQLFRKCAANGNVKEMEEFYNKGSDIDINGISPSTGRSALHWAAMCGHEDAVSFLLMKGAILDLKDNKQQTPFDLAYENGYFVVAALIDPKLFFIETSKSFSYDLEQHLFKVTNKEISFYLLGTEHDAAFVNALRKNPDIIPFLNGIEHFIGEINSKQDYNAFNSRVLETFDNVLLSIGSYATVSSAEDFFVTFKLSEDIKQKYQQELKNLMRFFSTSITGRITENFGKLLPPWAIFILPGITYEYGIGYPGSYAKGIDETISWLREKAHVSALETSAQRFDIAKKLLEGLEPSQLAEWMKNEDPMQEFLLPYTHARNQMWTENLVSRKPEELNNSLVYCGLAHLYGNSGLIELLRANNFTVTRISSITQELIEKQQSSSVKKTNRPNK